MADKVTMKRVNHLVQKWFRRLMLSDLWTISIKIHQTEAEETDEAARENEAYVTFTDGYDHIDMVINAWLVPEGGLELTVAHELTHVALRELEMLAEAGQGKKMAKFVEAAVERVTERLSRAMVSK